MKRDLFTRRRVGVAGIVLAAGVVLAFGAAFAYAHSQKDVIADGVHVAGVDVGGLSKSDARARLTRAFAPLQQPLVLRYPGGQVALTARSAGVRVETDALVDRAAALSHGSWFLPRAWRDLTGGDVHANLRPQVEYSRPAVEKVVRELQRRIDRPARNATLTATFKLLLLKRGHRGVAVGKRLLRRQIRLTLTHRTAPREFDVPIVHPRPRMTVARLRRRYPSFITIDRGRFKLRVWNHLRLAKSYGIAVGQVGLQTPAGLYHIQNKAVNPAWQVPFSSWTGSLAGRLIPPGPDNPLKARWLGIFNGAGIHGTEESWSIGHAVSHGCVRMLIPDVIDLYDRVQVHTPVYIGN